MHSSVQCASVWSKLCMLEVAMHMQIGEWCHTDQEGRTEEEGGRKVIIEKEGVSG